MLKERARAVAYWVWTTDLVLTAAAFLLAWWLRSYIAPQFLPSHFPTELFPLSRYLGILPFVLLIWTLLLVNHEAYTSRRTVALFNELWQVVRVVGLGTLALAASGWMLRLDFMSRPFLLLCGGGGGCHSTAQPANARAHAVQGEWGSGQFGPVCRRL